MVYYIFCSCLFIFAWLFIGIFFLKSGCQNNYSLGIISIKQSYLFLCFLTLPSHQTSKIRAHWLTWRKRLLFYFWYVKPRLNAFSGIWSLGCLQNEHKQKEPNFPTFPNFNRVQVQNKISKSITVKSALLFDIQKRGFHYRYCFDLLQLVLLILIEAMQKYKIIMKTFFINYCLLDLSKMCINSSRPSFQLVGGYNKFSSCTTYSKYSTIVATSIRFSSSEYAESISESLIFVPWFLTSR